MKIRCHWSVFPDCRDHKEFKDQQELKDRQEFRDQQGLQDRMIQTCPS